MRRNRRNLMESPRVQQATKTEIKQLVKYYLTHCEFPKEYTSDCRIMTLSKQSIKNMLVYEWEFKKNKQYLLVRMDEARIKMLTDMHNYLKSPDVGVLNEYFETFKSNFLK